jgi:cytokinin dehydrogenase
MNRRQLLELAQSASIYLFAGKIFFGQKVLAQTREAFLRADGPSFMSTLPAFDGAFVFDVNSLKLYSRDFGLNFSAKPQGILKPANSKDIQKMALYCNSRNIPLTARGGGGSAYGQSQIQNGILIDTTTLKKAQWISNNSVSLDVGLIWKEVTDFTLKKKMIPPVLPDTLATTVGGLLSAGGIGETSYNLGSLADHVFEIEVVTLSGEIKMASISQNADLFYSALGGMGQTCIITQVKLNLMRAPDNVKTLEYSYDFEDPQLFLDMVNFQSREPQGALGGHFVRPESGSSRWQYQLHATFWGRDSAAWIQQMRGKLVETKIRKFDEYINRNTQSWIDAVKSGALEWPRPYLSFFMPIQTGPATLKHLFKSSEALLGVSKFYLAPVAKGNFKRPFLSLPQSENILHFRLYKVFKEKPGSPDHLKALRSNEFDLIPRILNNGGTVYLPFAKPLTDQEVAKQYPQRLLQTFAQLKNHYDRKLLLNQGAGIFN